MKKQIQKSAPANGWATMAMPAENVINNNYFKMPEEGKYRVKILSEMPVCGYVHWQDNKPTYYRTDSVPANIERKNLKQFLGTLIYNTDLKQVQIWTISQQQVIQDLRMILAEEKHQIADFDLVIRRSGLEKTNTRYSLSAIKPPTEVPAESQAQMRQINLEAFFSGANPFAIETEEKLPWE